MNAAPIRDSYDVVIVGAGVAGALLAEELAKKNKRVLILEAGPRPNDNDRQTYVNNFYTAWLKLPESPYPPLGPDSSTSADPATQCAPRATSAALVDWPRLGDPRRPEKIEAVNEKSHLTYPPDTMLPFLSTYERLYGGTTWHWLGTCLRMLPNDFRTRTLYGRGRDWPLDYDALMPCYRRAEAALLVAASVDDQKYHGVHFEPGYKYPGNGGDRIPPTYSDQCLDSGMQGLTLYGQVMKMASTPQARYLCPGNNSCIPVCPAASKYDATRTLGQLDNDKVDIVTQAVATAVRVDSTGKVTGIEFQRYDDPGRRPTTTRETAVGKIYVLAAHAIETARLLLLSRTSELPNGVANSSDQVGRNLMDHVVYLGWGLMDKDNRNYPFRGPRSSSGIESLRDGPFRKDWAAFRVDVGNEGWGWADNDPATIVQDLVDGTNKSQLNPCGRKLFGEGLVRELNDKLTRQVRFCYLVEQDPDPENRVALSKRYTDGLGLWRPEIRYRLSDYTMAGFVKAQEVTEQVFNKAGVRNYTRFTDEVGFPAFEYRAADGRKDRFNAFGAGHIVGTYRMGSQKTDSVVDSYQRTWDHPNLFLLGSGTFPTIATSNPTLTIAALTYRTAEKILKDLGH
jgi:choline dehydrogenase-like flavoprotein